jgi:hypothetical protein
MDAAMATHAFRAAAGSDRIDWSAIRDRVDLAAVATALLGPAPGRRGERGRRLWWVCPFHADQNPSLCVNPGKPWWKCYGCDAHGDAMELARRLNPGWSFRDAATWLAELVGIVTPSGRPAIRPRPRAARMPAKAPQWPPEQPSGLPLADALSATADAEQRLWTPEGRPALEYLRRDRGLRDEKIRAARLGYVDKLRLPKRDGSGTWPVAGITIPWFDRVRLVLLKIRRLGLFNGARYIEAFRDRPTIYPSPSVIRPDTPLGITEGEFDALLLGQELWELAAVVTLGSTSSTRPDPTILGMMLPAPVWYLATDADGSGNKAAETWIYARARRVTPPAGKDWTEAYQAGIDLRRWWIEEVFADRFVHEERTAIRELDEGPPPPAVVGPPIPPDRQAVAASGDDLRARGLAQPLCSLSEPQQRVVLPPLLGLGRTDDGKLWFE